ncbi:rhomboid family-domain-containing protein [Dichotomocladium elegans]|nr:rhomboid family-domain-containing protein [Dichotomocladium elegans]
MYYTPARRRWPAVFTTFTALAMLGVLIFELVYNKIVTGNVIETSPFNIMIGPSAPTLILSGARFVPCMHPTASYTIDGPHLCPNMTDYGQTGPTAPTLVPTRVNTTMVGVDCSLQEVCGMTRFKSPDYPDQWYRFLSAIFLHSGVIHFILNSIVHLSLGASMERLLNPLFYAIIWLASGAFGFIFGGVLAPVGNASVGCSGALFGVVALLFIDLFATWKQVMYPGWELTKLIFLILLSFVVGLLPGLDNFAHIGGFICGLITGTIFYPICPSSRTNKLIMWVVRLVLLGGLIGMFYGMLQLFYSGRTSNEASHKEFS